MSTTITPNMGLPTPVVGVEPGPDYGTDNNNCFNIIDAHDHSTGNGVPITPDGMNISAPLPFNNNPATTMKYIQYTVQGSSPGVLGSTYVSGVDLYYTDRNGNDIQITASGGVAGSNGSIANLVSPASASYVVLTTKFVWQSDANVAADMDGGAVIIREKIANAKGITLQSPASLGSDYAVTLPAALPVSGTKFVTLNSSGVMGDAYDVDNSTIEVSANVIQVKDLGITTAKIANGAVTRAKLSTIAVSNGAGTGAQVITSVGYSDVTGASVTITVDTPNRPVVFVCCPTDNTHPSYISSDTSSLSDPACIQLLEGSTVYAQWVVGNGVFSPSMITYIAAPAAGSKTFKLQAKRAASATNVTFNYVSLNVYEL